LSREACKGCGKPLAQEQRYCVSCGARRGLLPGVVAGTMAAMSAKAKVAASKDGDGKGHGAGSGGGDGKGDGGGWSWMPSPPAIAIAVIGMLGLGVGLGSAMSEVASSAPLSTILLEYPSHAEEGAPSAEEPEAEELTEAEPELAEVPQEATEEVVDETPLPIHEDVVEEAPLLPEEATEDPELVPFDPEEEGENFLEEEEEELPEVRHAFLVVLGEGGYDETFGGAAGAPYLSRVLPKKGELLPHYYGVTSGVLANEIALLSGQGPTPETAANCPDYTAIVPGNVSVFAEQVEGDGCVYGEEVKSLPTQLSEKEVTWRAYVQDMEDGGAIGQPWRCRKPTFGGPDPTAPTVGDQYASWRNPVVYFAAITAGDECEKHDVGFELLTKDLSAKKKTPALSLIFPNVCHSGGEYECEPGAPKGAHGVATELKTLVPAIMASPAYEEGGLIMITSAQAKQTGEGIDQKACCLVPEFPNLPTAEVATDGGGKVGLLMISPFVEPGRVEETEYANHFTLLKTLATMLGVEPTGYAAEEEVSILSPELFLEEEPAEEESTGGG
jgi:hypothetical protein